MTTTRDLSARRSQLSPAKRDLLQKRIKGKAKSVATVPSIMPRPAQVPAELSFAQLRLWFLHQLEPDSTAYHISSAIRIKGPLNLTSLEKSLNWVIQRHDTLRTTFPIVKGQPIPLVASHLTLKLPVIDLQHQSKNEREAEVIALAQKDSQKPFDLTQGPLFRGTLLQMSEEEYVFLVSLHHIISDEWSMRVLIQEVGLFYEAFSQDDDVSLPELPIQYADFAYWQRQWLQGDILEKQINYWQEQLQGSPPLLELPTDHARPAKQSHRGSTQSLDLSSDLTSKLKALCQCEDVTLFMMLLAAFQTLLYRYSGQTDILVGSPIANRNRIELESVIGFFANTLVLRTDFSGNPTFREVLSRVREVALEAYTHQDLPFEVLVEKLQPERNLSYHPLFQVMFVLQYAPAETTKLLGLSADFIEIEHSTAKFDLTLFIEETSEGLKCKLEFNTDLFDTDTIRRMLGHFQILLEGIVTSGGGVFIAELPLLTDAERHQLLVEWNDTQTNYPEICFHQLFETQVEKTPEATAVIFGDEQLSYQALNERANQLAHYLRTLGVGPEILVGICVERSIEMVVGVLGILKAGGAYVPFNPDDPTERISFMLADSRVSILLTQQQLAEALPAAELETILLDSDWERIGQEKKENPQNWTSVDNLAYVIYTSGSTGKPKGVMIQHRGLTNYLTWCIQTYPFNAGDGVPVHSPISFDLAVTSLFAPLLVGSKLHLLPNGLEIDTLTMALQGKVEFSLVKLTPAHLELLKPQLIPRQGFGNTKAFIIGGENLRAETAALCYDNSCDVILVNEYGPTETVVGCCTYEIPRGKHQSGSVPIGHPIANTQIYLLDSNLQPVPVGLPGEIYIGGVALARGYLNQPELTQQKFIRNPFTQQPETRLYKTGDVARYLLDGNVEFLGRIDNQVKLRGFRIELGEIEAVLQQHKAVEDVVAILREDVPGDKRLVAYIIAAQSQSPATAELDYFLKRKLPAYMIPSSIVFLEAFPLTSNGKLDRHALPAPDHISLKRESTFITPRDTLETKLVEIWEEILAVQPISINDNFFDLGGHSLLAVRLFARIEVELGRSLPVATLFQLPTIAQLANLLRQEDHQPISSLVPIQPEGSNPPFFCVHGMGGGVLDYVDLSRHLGPDQPFYGLQERGLDDIHEPFSTIEEMAAHYIKQIQIIQPEGPYYLGGYCYGGTVAFEIARQLETQDHQVGLLAIIDNTAPNLGHYTALWKPRVMTKFLINLPNLLRDFFQLNPSDRINRIFRRGRILKEDIRHVFWPRSNPQPTKSDIEAIIDADLAQIPRKYHKFLEAHFRALQNYTPQPYSGPITLFRTRRYSLFGPFEYRMGWDKLTTAEVVVKEVTGFHASILQLPYVQQLAQQLCMSLDEAR